MKHETETSSPFPKEENRLYHLGMIFDNIDHGGSVD